MDDLERIVAIEAHETQILDYLIACSAVANLVVKARPFVIEGQGNCNSFIRLIERLASRQNNDVLHFIRELPAITDAAPGIANISPISMFDMLPIQMMDPAVLNQPKIERQAREFGQAAEAKILSLRKGLIALLSPAMYWPQSRMLDRAQLCIYARNINMKGIAN